MIDNLYKKDFFHEVFHEMMSAESGMFMFNDSQTLAWFPSRVRLHNETAFISENEEKEKRNIQLIMYLILKQLSLPTLGDAGASEVLPVWAPMWIGFVQQLHRILALPNGSVQEAARGEAFT